MTIDTADMSSAGKFAFKTFGEALEVMLSSTTAGIPFLLKTPMNNARGPQTTANGSLASRMNPVTKSMVSCWPSASLLIHLFIAPGTLTRRFGPSVDSVAIDRHRPVPHTLGLQD